MLQTIKTLIPANVRSRLSYAYYLPQWHSYARKKFGDRYVWQATGSMPPDELITTEALMRQTDLEYRRRPGWYFTTGCRAARGIIEILEQHSFDLRNLKSLLEFGCGSARVLRHFRSIRDLYLAGTDANSKPIEWARGNLAGIDFRINQLEPPLPFEDGSFDVIYALSVFTHIPLEWQRSWLEELRRILRPGGYLICTVHGMNNIRQNLSLDDQAKLQQDGELVLARNDPRASYSTKVLGSWDIYQQRNQVRDVFGSIFAIRSYTDEAMEQDMLLMGHDILVLQRG